VAAALQIWSATFSKAFDALPDSTREAVRQKLDEMSARLPQFPHKRLQGRPEFKLRAGDYRVLTNSTCPRVASISTTLATVVRSINCADTSTSLSLFCCVSAFSIPTSTLGFSSSSNNPQR
jgi:hypothetical protein